MRHGTALRRFEKDDITRGAHGCGKVAIDGSVCGDVSRKLAVHAEGQSSGGATKRCTFAIVEMTSFQTTKVTMIHET
jgi:hypothetical protein